MAAFADTLDLKLNGLFKDSLQGDSVAVEMGFHFGIDTEYTEGGLHLKKSGNPLPELFEWDFVKCPDIAQTFAVMCGGVGVQGLFTGLETLFIKETDRVQALKNELSKLDVSFVKLPARFAQKTHKQYFMIDGKATFEKIHTFPTYEDHRMAMAFAPFAMFDTIKIEDPSVVAKSYTQFWEDLKKLGFMIEEGRRQRHPRCERRKRTRHRGKVAAGARPQEHRLPVEDPHQHEFHRVLRDDTGAVQQRSGLALLLQQRATRRSAHATHVCS